MRPPLKKHGRHHGPDQRSDAAYQYYVVRLNSQHEVSEVINAGQVQIPESNP